MGMYGRSIKRKNKDRSEVEYIQLAHNTRHPEKGYTRAEVVYSFGRRDHLDIEQPIHVQHLYRSMDFFLEHESAIQEKVFWVTAHLMNLTVDLIFFDTTNTCFEIKDPGNSAM